ncbi:nucleotide disphospho-sugar-binding domain-containing protein [Kitasatospora sp. MAP5-34]|uniref:nucleotide disphospho-sugar-binding domain-containing protein n=1 Tax=Kitasatospora sp. MAP5-34 TaxID=3035102 RepID=UPI002475EBF5|nr:nucleotide disphospho-sugar-binding domain-containing protein [Kitasatospora sp. MAP5-34]MDH6579804.1 UDP:flavonoid glycosyltransferase YjiC (YdhE family) [Kitasatospora sp. MAP5-34]
MRILFTTWAWPSHLYSLVPLAWACRAAGHEVLIASQPGILDETVRTGLPAAAVGHDVDAAALVRGYLLPSTAVPAPVVPAGPEGKGPRAMRMFYAHADSMVDDLTELARDWHADLVVYEPTALAGPIAAAAAGIPAVRHLYGTDLLVRARAMLPAVLAPLAERNGAAAFDPFGAVTIDPCPDGFQLPVDYPRLPVRYVPFNGPGAAPAPPLAPPAPGRSRVVVTWGHTLAKLSTAHFFAPQAAAALTGPDTEVVLAVSAAQQPLLTDLPDDIKTVVDVPLNLLLPGADLVVSHGGAGTVLTALHAGLPLLLVPQLPDHAGHSARVLAVGAGEVLSRDEATPGQLREDARRLLDSGAPGRAARLLRERMFERPTPADLVTELEALAERSPAAAR